ERHRAGVVATVVPTVVTIGTPLAVTSGAGNAALITTADGWTHVVRGQGAGRWPTAQSVVADLLSLAVTTPHSGGTAEPRTAHRSPVPVSSLPFVNA
ncbi:MAG: hypothetical protein H7Y88_04490, partial [Phycisphaerales bacterium]|nr:hypothetical protein [Phycisphaerales bacterium]